MGKDSNQNGHADSASVGYDALHKALILSGDVVPTSVEDVLFLERAAQPLIPLPDHLRDPGQVIARAQAMDAFPKKPGQTKPTLITELARAAREGGEISAEIEARMKAAREQADRNDADNSKG